MRARIEYKKFNKEESLKLKPFLPIADYFGRRWNRTVVLDAPHGEEESPFASGDEKKRAHIHFFCAPPGNPSFYRETGFVKDFCGFPVPQEGLELKAGNPICPVLVSGNDVAAKLPARQQTPTIHFLRSSRGEVVAQVAKNHLYILFDLAHRPWPAALPAFWEILEAATSYLKFGSEDQNLGVLISLHEMTRAKTLKKKAAVFENFKALSTFLLEEECKETLQKREEKRIEMLNLEKEITRILLRTEFLNDILSKSEEDEEFSDGSLAAEFELIHGYKSFLGMEVRDEKNELHLFTKPIEHIGYDENPRMLSQYKIVLKLDELGRSGNTFTGIKMAEWGWLGPYHHPEAYINDTFDAEPKSPCFGSQFVMSIEKSFLDYDCKVLIALLLHYLDSDSRLPVSRSSTQQTKEPYQEKPFYLSDFARNRTREKYIEFARRFKKAFRKKNLEEEILRLGRESIQKNSLWVEARKEFILLGIKSNFLRAYIDNLPLKEEFDAINGISALTVCHVGPNFIWLVFGPGKGKGLYENVLFPGTFRVLIKIPEARIDVLGCLSHLAEDGFLRNRLAGDSDLRQAWIIRKHFAKGLFGRGLVLLHNFLRGQELGEGKEDEMVSKESIAQYLQNRTFPSFVLLSSASSPRQTEDIAYGFC